MSKLGNVLWRVRTRVLEKVPVDVLVSVLMCVLGGVLVGVGWGVLGSVLGGVLGGVLRGVLEGVLEGVPKADPTPDASRSRGRSVLRWSCSILHFVTLLIPKADREEQLGDAIEAMHEGAEAGYGPVSLALACLFRAFVILRCSLFGVFIKERRPEPPE
ncbi:MAG: hypothetical protein AAGI30_10990 [Planctomycetota bacterium]